MTRAAISHPAASHPAASHPATSQFAARRAAENPADVRSAETRQAASPGTRTVGTRTVGKRTMQSGRRGFSFLEVIMALSILVMGSVSVLVLFAMGVSAQVHRRIDERERQARPEISQILQEAVDNAKPGAAPSAIRDRDLSQKGYGLEVDWKMDPFDGSTAIAFAYITYSGQRVKGLGPKPVVRAKLDPTKWGK